MGWFLLDDEVVLKGKLYSFVVEGLQVHDLVLVGPKQVLDLQAHHPILGIHLAQSRHHVPKQLAVSSQFALAIGELHALPVVELIR